MTSEKLSPALPARSGGSGSERDAGPEEARGRARTSRGTSLSRALDDLRDAGGLGAAPIPAPAGGDAARAEPALAALLGRRRRASVDPEGAPPEEGAAPPTPEAEPARPTPPRPGDSAATVVPAVAPLAAATHAGESDVAEHAATESSAAESEVETSAGESSEEGALEAGPFEAEALAAESLTAESREAESLEEEAPAAETSAPQLHAADSTATDDPESSGPDAPPAPLESREPTGSAERLDSAGSAGPAELADHRLEPAPAERRPGVAGSPRGSASLDSTLTQTIRRWAKPTTPRELEARGVKRLRSVSMSRIASLIEKAINRELIARTLDGDADDALSLSSDARAGFLELARSEMSGRVDHEEESSASATLERLRAELEARRAELVARERQRESAEPGADEDAAVEQRLRAVFAAHPAARDASLERAVLEAALTEVGLVRERAREERRARELHQTRQLERRIAKLSGLLEQSEVELRRIRARRAEDPGVASMFEDVQGLDGGDERFEQKLGLMKSIFEANLELQH